MTDPRVTVVQLVNELHSLKPDDPLPTVPARLLPYFAYLTGRTWAEHVKAITGRELPGADHD